MDNKDFQFLCINTKSLWDEGVVKSGDLDISEEGITLKQEKTYTYKKAYKQIGRLIDFGLDQCGVIYGLEKEGRIVRFDPCTGHKELIEYIEFLYPKVIAISSSNIFVVHGESNESTARITAMARVNYQVRWESVINGTDIEDIKDIAVDSKENLYVLSADTVHRYNACGKSPDFGREWSAFVNDLDEPVSIAVDESDAIYVLDKPKRAVKKFSTTRDGKRQEFPLQIPKEVTLSGLAVLKETVYVGVGTFVGKIRILYGFDISQYKIAYPGDRGGYTGKCDSIRINLRGDIHILDRQASEIALLGLEERFVTTEATYESKLLDSYENGCQWHKFVLEREIPDNTQIAISYHISDYKYVYADEDALVWSKILLNPEDALILSPKGRYIKFKLVLSSTDERDTPRINSLKVFFPRKSYLRYLPAIYQEDQISQDFLERFLSLFETVLWELEENTNGITHYFDVEGTPEEFLRWLSSWLGISTDENWLSKKRRKLLKEAPELFKKRGTREGLKELIGIFLEDPVFVKPLKKLIEDLKDKTSKESLEGLERLRRESGHPIIVEYFQLKPAEKLGLMRIQPGTYKKCYYVKTSDEQCDMSIRSKVEVVPDDPTTSKEIISDKKLVLFLIDSENDGGANDVQPVKIVETEFITLSRTVSFCATFSVVYIETILKVKTPLHKVKVTDFLIKNGKVVARNCLLFIQPWARLFGNCPYRFCVLLKPFSIRHEAELNTVRRIIEQEKPAHTKGGVVLLQPWLYLDMHTYLGVNTILSEPRFVLGKDSVISRNTVLASMEESGQIDLRARVGMDTVLT